MTLTEFLLARIAEDEETARAAAAATRPRGGWGGDHRPTGEQWETRAGAGIHRESGMLYVPTIENSADAALWDDEGGCDYMAPALAVGEHIARHDPARVLAEGEAKRNIIEMVTGAVAMSEVYSPFLLALRALAAPYADHPDYRDEWAA